VSAARGLIAGAIVAIAMVGAAACRAPAFLTGPRLTGTCDGACDHYFECKGGGQTSGARARCLADCRDVFSDDESLRAFESLSCQDAVEYVDGQVMHASEDGGGERPATAGR
jgi:hypothetical protein